MRKLYGMPALCIVLGTIVVAACSDHGEADLLASARDALSKRDVRAASIQLKTLLQTHPSSGEARLLLGRALLESGDTAGAEIQLRKAAELAQPEGLVAPLLARAWLLNGQFKSVTDAYADTGVADPAANAELKTSVALAYAAQGASDAARGMIGKALAIDPQSTPAAIASARIKAGNGDSDGALVALDELLKRTETFEAWQLKGDLLTYGRADYRAATESYQRALALRPNDPTLLACLISLSYLQADEAAAARHFATLQSVHPKHPLTLRYGAEAAFAKGDYNAARTQLVPLIGAVPDDAGLLHVAGATEYQLGALPQAEVYLAKAIQLRPDFLGARMMLAKVHLKAHQPAKALAILQPAVERRGVDPQTLTLAGQAALLADDPQLANDYFHRAAAMKPTDTRVRATLALSQMQTGSAESTLSSLRAIAGADAGSAADMALITLHLQRGETDGALQAIAALDAKQPNNPAGAELRGRVLLLKKDPAGARESFDTAVRRDPRYLPAVLHLAALDVVEQHPQAAEARLQALLRQEPTSVEALLALADLRRRGGGPSSEVAQWIRKAVDADPSSLRARLALVDHYAALNEIQAALQAARDGAAALPFDPEMQNSLARTLARSGDLNSAGAVYGKLTSQLPDSSLGHIGRAEVLLAQKDPAGASRAARRALALAPHSLAAQRVAIAAALRDGRPDDAITVARTVQAQRSTDPLGFILEGEIEGSRGRWDAAANAFRKAAAKPKPAQAPARVHFALLQAKKQAEADKYARAWLADHPDDALFLFYLGENAAAQGDLAAAERHYDRVLRLQPDNAPALNNAAWLRIRQGKPGAVALAQRAIKAAPDRAALLDTLAMAQLQENLPDAALETEKRAMAIAPDTPDFRLSLAKIYLRSGRKQQAKDELATLAKLGPSFAGQSEVDRLTRNAQER